MAREETAAESKHDDAKEARRSGGSGRDRVARLYPAGSAERSDVRCGENRSLCSLLYPWCRGRVNPNQQSCERADKGRKDPCLRFPLRSGWFCFGLFFPPNLSEGALWWLMIGTANPQVEGHKELPLFSQSCSTLDPMDCSTPGFPILHYLPEFVQTHLH